MLVRIKWPKEFIGKWVATRVVGTHGSYEQVINSLHGGLGVFVFNTEKEARKNLKNESFTPITHEDYPVLEVEIEIMFKTSNKENARNS